MRARGNKKQRAVDGTPQKHKKPQLLPSSAQQKLQTSLLTTNSSPTEPQSSWESPQQQILRQKVHFEQSRHSQIMPRGDRARAGQQPCFNGGKAYVSTQQGGRKEVAQWRGLEGRKSGRRSKQLQHNCQFCCFCVCTPLGPSPPSPSHFEISINNKSQSTGAAAKKGAAPQRRGRSTAPAWAAAAAAVRRRRRRAPRRSRRRRRRGGGPLQRLCRWRAGGPRRRRARRG